MFINASQGKVLIMTSQNLEANAPLINKQVNGAEMLTAVYEELRDRHDFGSPHLAITAALLQVQTECTTRLGSKKPRSTKAGKASAANAPKPSPSPIVQWVDEHHFELATYEPKDVPHLHYGLSNRWSPLFAVADVAGGEWSSRARLAAKEVELLMLEMPVVPVELINDVLKMFADSGSSALPTLEILQRLNTHEGLRWRSLYEGGLTPSQLTLLLSPFEVKSRHVRTADGKRVRGYCRSDFGFLSSVTYTSDGSAFLWERRAPGLAGLGFTPESWN